jgi:hypothetical protein
MWRERCELYGNMDSHESRMADRAKLVKILVSSRMEMKKNPPCLSYGGADMWYGPDETTTVGSGGQGSPSAVKKKTKIELRACGRVRVQMASKQMDSSSWVLYISSVLWPWRVYSR